VQRIGLALLIMVLAALAIGCAADPRSAPSPVMVDDPAATFSLEGSWRFAEGDDARWADPAFDDAGWRTLQVPGIWRFQGVHGDGFGWYRRRFDVGANAAARDLGIEVPYTYWAYEVFVNGQPIEGRYSLPSRWGGLPAGSVNVFRVPARLLVRGDNLVALRTHGGMGYGGVYRENARIGALRTIDRAFDREIVVQLGVAAICFFIGVYHLLIFLNRKEQRYAYLSYAAYALILSVFLPGYAGFWYVVTSSQWLNTLAEFGAFTAAVPVIPVFMHAFFRVPPNWFTRASVWLTALNLAWMAGEIALRGSLTSYLLYFPLVVVAFTVTYAYSLAIVVRAARRHEKDSWLMMASFVFFSFCTTNDVARFFVLIPGGLRLGHWGFLGFCVGMAIAIGNQYSRMTQSLAKLSTGLEAAVAAQTSELRSKNDQLVHQAEELRSLDLLKRQFYTNVSHELRTPLTLILGFGRALRGRFSGGDRAAIHDLDAIQRNAAHLLREINDLLDVARLEAGRMTLAVAPVDLRSLVRDVAANFAPADAGAAGRRLQVELPARAAELYLDFDKIRKVVFNLLSNAFKFTSEQTGLITVRVAVPDEHHVSLEVEDNGIGITAESLAHIFERFRQADNSSTRRYEGTGIGLALVKELTELHGGTVTVRSRPGVGSTFTVVFRTGAEHLRDDQVKEESVPSEAVGELLAVSSRGDSQPPLTPATGAPSDPGAEVLVVEDHRDLREYLTGLLSGYRVRAAADGVEALKCIEERVPQLVISDVMMPNMDGYELCASIKSNPATSHVPIILLTAQAGLAPKVRGLDVRADDYLTKPFQEEELLARVRNLLIIQRQNAELREREAEVREANQRLQVKVLEQADALQRRGRLGRFLPPQVVDELLENAGVALERKRRSVAIVCAELCDFDELAGAVEPEDLTVLFGRFHTLTTEIVFRLGGTIASLHGGSLQAVFGAPKALEPADAAAAAVRAGRELLDAIDHLGESWRDLDPVHALVLKGGIALGHATVGAFGDGEWASFAAIGGPAAIAPRLRDAAPPGVILVSSRAAKYVLADHGLTGPGRVQTGSWSQEVWRLEAGSFARQGAGATSSGERRVLAAAGSEGTDPVGETREDVLRASSALAPGESTRTVSLRVGSVLGDRYQLDTELGSGGMGVVFAASDRLLGERIALKVLADPLASASDRLERLRREVRLARLVTHPNVCRVFDLQVLEGLACLTMELIDGRSLAAALRNGEISVPRALDWSLQICDALAAAHACGIVHRDLKPDNVLLEKTGRLVIADFGIARPMNAIAETQGEGIAGTLDYLAPEQLSSDAPPDARSDIYALGVLLFELFTRELPFVGRQPAERAIARCTQRPRDPAEIVPSMDPRLRAVVLRCLRRDLNERFQRVADVSTALAAIIDRETEVSSPRPARPPGQRTPTLVSG
jgi:signal transduction histidine kinase/DNA-binding response OmpR family regulator